MNYKQLMDKINHPTISRYKRQVYNWINKGKSILQEIRHVIKKKKK